MDKKILIFSGMPASGKDTVTEKLCENDKSFIALKKYRSYNSDDTLKDTYFNISQTEFENKIKSNDFIQYHKRYGRYYGIDEQTLFEYCRNGLIPIIHIGRIENFYCFQGNLNKFSNKYRITPKITHVQLWESFEEICRRIRERNKTANEIKKRIDAAEQEFNDCAEIIFRGEKPYTAVIKNSDLSETLGKITRLVFDEKNLNDDGYKEFAEYLNYWREKHGKNS